MLTCIHRQLQSREARSTCDIALLRCFVIFVICVAGLLLTTQARAEPEGRFEVVRAEARAVDDTWLVDALFDLSLDSDTQQALRNGVTLTIQMQFEVLRKRLFWPDEIVLEKKQSVELRYLLLSQRYVVTYTDTNTQSSYATLYSALRYISQLRDYPLLPTDQLKADGRYDVALRVVLVKEDLPGPLQMLAFWSGDFTLESEWYWWTLKQ
jgi:Domain of unknown function (DUF4390)